MIVPVNSGQNSEKSKVQAKSASTCEGICQEVGHKCGPGHDYNYWDYTWGIIFAP